MARIKISVTGDQAVNEALAALGSRVIGEMKNLVATDAQEVLRDAQAAAPVLTGELRNSGKINYRSDGLGAEVEFDSDHAIFVELGTGSVGAGSSGTADLPPGYSYGPKHGMRAQPYLWPAFKPKRDGFQDEVTKRAQSVWTK